MPLIRELIRGVRSGAVAGARLKMRHTLAQHRAQSQARDYQALGLPAYASQPWMMPQPYAPMQGALSYPVAGAYGVSQPQATASLLKRDITIMLDMHSPAPLQSHGVNGQNNWNQLAVWQPPAPTGGYLGSYGSSHAWDPAIAGVRDLITQLQQFDPDGINLYVFSDDATRGYTQPPTVHAQLRDGYAAEQVLRGFQPQGHTDLHAALQQVFDQFLWNRPTNRYQGKAGETVIVITDGNPHDKPALMRTIINMTHTMRQQNIADSELGIVFVQVGQDPQAAQFLRELDDHLKPRGYNSGHGAAYDIVDCISISELTQHEITMPELLLGSIFG